MIGSIRIAAVAGPIHPGGSLEIAERHLVKAFDHLTEQNIEIFLLAAAFLRGWRASMKRAPK